MVWKHTVERLRPLGILGRMDTFALARYCVAHVQYVKAAQFVAQHGTTLSTKDTKGRINIRILPQFRIMMQLSAELLRMEQEFCLTPSSRANFGVFVDDEKKKPAEKTGKERFFHDD